MSGKPGVCQILVFGVQDHSLDVRQVVLRIPGRINKFETTIKGICRNCRAKQTGRFRYARDEGVLL